MVKKELILKGSLYGSKKISAYKSPDIINSIVDNHLCLINDFKIKYLAEKNRYYIYHSYNGLNEDMKQNYSGRWYSRDYEFIDEDLNEVDHTFTIELQSVDWEDFETGESINKNVKITINLSELGFNNLKNYFIILKNIV